MKGRGGKHLLRTLGWLIPILCMLVTATVFWRQSGVLLKAETLRDSAVVKIGQAVALRSAVDRQGQDRHYAAANDDGNEQNSFLDDLRLKAISSGATIVGWTANASTYGAQGGPSLVDPNDNNLVKGITRVDCLLTMKGPYAPLRNFVRDTTDSDRLYTLSGISWTRSGDGVTSLQLTLTRYKAANQHLGLPLEAQSAAASHGKKL